MRLTFVRHASLLLEHGEVFLLCDPWLRGDAFTKAWAPWPSPRLAPPRLARGHPPWVSHEHPDHLSVPTLRAIPAEVRGRIAATDRSCGDRGR